MILYHPLHKVLASAVCVSMNLWLQVVAVALLLHGHKDVRLGVGQTAGEEELLAEQVQRTGRVSDAEGGQASGSHCLLRR